MKGYAGKRKCKLYIRGGADMQSGGGRVLVGPHRTSRGYGESPERGRGLSAARLFMRLAPAVEPFLKYFRILSCPCGHHPEEYADREGHNAQEGEQDIHDDRQNGEKCFHRVASMSNLIREQPRVKGAGRRAGRRAKGFWAMPTVNGIQSKNAVSRSSLTSLTLAWSRLLWRQRERRSCHFIMEASSWK